MAAGDAIVGHVVTFGRVLREAGLEIGPGRLTDALRALDAVDLARRDDVYYSLRQTLVSRHDELALFDRAFDAWFLRAPVHAPAREATPEPTLRLAYNRQSNAGLVNSPAIESQQPARMRARVCPDSGSTRVNKS